MIYASAAIFLIPSGLLDTDFNSVLGAFAVAQYDRHYTGWSANCRRSRSSRTSNDRSGTPVPFLPDGRRARNA